MHLPHAHDGCQGTAFHLEASSSTDPAGTRQPLLVCDTCGTMHPIEWVTRRCAYCRNWLWGAARRDYCSDACKQQAYRERQARNPALTG